MLTINANNRDLRRDVAASAASSALGIGAYKVLLKSKVPLQALMLSEHHKKLKSVQKYGDELIGYADEFIKGSKLKDAFTIVRRPVVEQPTFKKILTAIFKQDNKSMMDMGLNATCRMRNKKSCAYIPNGYETTIFHELGHALDYQNASSLVKLKRIFMHTNKAAIFAIPLLALIMKTPMGKAKENETKAQKFERRFKNAAPFASAALYLPVVAEEFLASRSGMKAAKSLNKIPDKLLKSIKSTHINGFATYAITPLFRILALGGAIVLKDKLYEKFTKSQTS